MDSQQIKQSRTNEKVSYSKPASFQKWEDFQERMDSRRARLAGRRVTREKISPFTAGVAGRYESNVGALTLPPIGFTENMLKQCGRLRGFPELSTSGVEAETTASGLPDVMANYQGTPLFLMEAKRPGVRFETEHPPYEPAAGTNMRAVTLQTYHYLVSKNLLVYGAFTNYDNWVFLRRVHVNEEETLELTVVYDFNDALLALATFLTIVHTHAVRVGGQVNNVAAEQGDGANNAGGAAAITTTRMWIKTRTKKGLRLPLDESPYQEALAHRGECGTVGRFLFSSHNRWRLSYYNHSPSTWYC